MLLRPNENAPSRASYFIGILILLVAIEVFSIFHLQIEGHTEAVIVMCGVVVAHLYRFIWLEAKWGKDSSEAPEASGDPFSDSDASE